MSQTCQAGRCSRTEGRHVGVIAAVGQGVLRFRTGEGGSSFSLASAHCGTRRKCGVCERVIVFRYCVDGGWISATPSMGPHTSRVCAHFPTPTASYRVSDDADEEALVMLSDILADGFEGGRAPGKVSAGIKQHCHCGCCRTGFRTRGSADGTVFSPLTSSVDMTTMSRGCIEALRRRRRSLTEL